MKKRSNGLVIVLSTLIVICLACGTLGLYFSMIEDKPKEEEDNKDYKVVYRYFIDGTEVNKEVKQDYLEEKDPEFEGNIKKIEMYSFDRYTCTNDVKGTWDEEKWEFKPELTANTTCRLYFNKNIHEVTVKASNGKLPNNTLEQKINVEIDKEGILNVIPNDGYAFDKVDCTNGSTAEFDSNTKDLKIKNVKKDSICTISFKIRDYKVEVKASNGTVTDGNKTASYGNTVTFNVTPSENYKFERVECTNGLTPNATYADNKLTITGINNDTVCTVQFSPIKHTVSLTIDGGSFVDGYSSPITVADGKNTNFGVVALEGYLLTNADLTCDNATGHDRHEFTGGVVWIYGIRGNINCTLKLKKENE